MGALLSVLTAVSGGGAVAGATALLGVVSSISQYQQSQMQADSLRRQEQQAALNARAQDVKTNQELLINLSSMTAKTAASGLTGSGSAARAKEQARKTAQQELDISSMNADFQSLAYESKIESIENKGLVDFVTGRRI